MRINEGRFLIPLRIKIESEISSLVFIIKLILKAFFITLSNAKHGESIEIGNRNKIIIVIKNEIKFIIIFQTFPENLFLNGNYFKNYC